MIRNESLKVMHELSVLILAFNRSTLTKDLLKQLISYECSIYLSIDGPRNSNNRDSSEIQEIMRFVDQLRNRGNDIHVNLLDRNYGCRKAIISGINWFFQSNDQGIILEDDCHLHDGAIEFFASSLEKYKADKTIGMISGSLNLDCSIGKEFSCSAYNIWGWATWSDRWELNRSVSELRLRLADLKVKHPRYYPNLKFSLDVAEDVDTWDVQWCISLLSNNMKCLYPEKNLINNVGTYSSRNDSNQPPILPSKEKPRQSLKSPDEFERATYALHSPNRAKRLIASLGLYGLARRLAKRLML